MFTYVYLWAVQRRMVQAVQGRSHTQALVCISRVVSLVGAIVNPKTLSYLETPQPNGNAMCARDVQAEKQQQQNGE
jgi:hypothetical protein